MKFHRDLLIDLIVGIDVDDQFSNISIEDRQDEYVLEFDYNHSNYRIGYTVDCDGHISFWTEQDPQGYIECEKMS